MRGTVRMASNSQKPLSATHKTASHHIKHAPVTFCATQTRHKNQFLSVPNRPRIINARAVSQASTPTHPREMQAYRLSQRQSPAQEEFSTSPTQIQHTAKPSPCSIPRNSTHHKNTAQSRSQSEQFITQVLPLQKHRATSANVPARIEG